MVRASRPNRTKLPASIARYSGFNSDRPRYESQVSIRASSSSSIANRRDPRFPATLSRGSLVRQAPT